MVTGDMMGKDGETRLLAKDEKAELSEQMLYQDEIIQEIESITDEQKRRKVLLLVKLIDQNLDSEIKELHKKSSTSTLFTGLHASSLYTSMSFNQFIQTPSGAVPMREALVSLKEKYNIDIEKYVTILFYEKFKLVVTSHLFTIIDANSNANLMKKIVLEYADNQKSRKLMVELLNNMSNHPSVDNDKIMDVLLVLFSIDLRFNDIKDQYPNLFSTPRPSEIVKAEEEHNTSTSIFNLSDFLPEFIQSYLRNFRSKFNSTSKDIQEDSTHNSSGLDGVIYQQLLFAKDNNKEYLLQELAISNAIVKGIDSGDWYSLCHKLTSETCTFPNKRSGFSYSSIDRNPHVCWALGIKNKIESPNSPQSTIQNIFKEIQLLNKNKLISTSLIRNIENQLKNLRVPAYACKFIDYSINRDCYSQLMSLLSDQKSFKSIQDLVVQLKSSEVTDTMLVDINTARLNLQDYIDERWNSEENKIIEFSSPTKRN
ncbi:MAG: hypothetical protein P1U74_08800 [Legionellaceae bacterium]|nr:hypothetical protein [Legionellaceae bacterium]